MKQTTDSPIDKKAPLEILKLALSTDTYLIGKELPKLQSTSHIPKNDLMIGIKDARLFNFDDYLKKGLISPHYTIMLRNLISLDTFIADEFCCKTEEDLHRKFGTDLKKLTKITNVVINEFGQLHANWIKEGTRIWHYKNNTMYDDGFSTAPYSMAIFTEAYAIVASAEYLQIFDAYWDHLEPDDVHSRYSTWLEYGPGITEEEQKLVKNIDHPFSFEAFEFLPVEREVIKSDEQVDSRKNEADRRPMTVDQISNAVSTGLLTALILIFAILFLLQSLL